MIHDNYMKLEEFNCSWWDLAWECFKKTTNDGGNVECPESAMA